MQVRLGEIRRLLERSMEASELSDEDLRRTAYAMGLYKTSTGLIPYDRPFTPEERSELEGMVTSWPIREALEPLDLPVTVYGPYRRGRGDFTAMIGFDWKTYENEQASMRLRKFSDAHGKILGPETPDERDVWDGFDSAWFVRLDADNDREARFQSQMIASKLEGTGFAVDFLPTSPLGLHPYR